MFNIITISQATIEDFETIQQVAYATWPFVYGEILSKAQLNYMLENFYSDATLTDNLVNKGHRFILANESDFRLGFASCEHRYLGESTTRLHKIYLLTESQGKGIGKMLIDEISALAKENQCNAISLNVNKFNKAHVFYKRMGFEVIAEEDLEIGNGYLMEDYRIEKKL